MRKLTLIEDVMSTDDAVAQAFVAELPPTLRIAGAALLREMVGTVITRERWRCQAVLINGARYHAGKKLEAETRLQSAVLAGTTANEIERIGYERLQAIAAANALDAASRVVMVPPGTCGDCAGTGQVRSTIMLVGGAAGAMQCPKCGGHGKAVAPAPTNGPVSG